MDRYSVMIDDKLPMCRICLDEDKDSVLFSPCRCSGSTGYVHYECLNKWRIADISNRHTCEICLYDYKIDNCDRPRFIKYGYYSDTHVLNIIFRYNLCITFLTLILVNIIEALDKNKVCISWTGNNILNISDYTIALIYLNITTVLELCVYVIYIISGISFLVNKNDYYKHWGGESIVWLIMFTFIAGTVFFIGKYEISTMMFYCINYVMSYKHIKSIYYLNDFCSDRIKEYNINDDV